MYTYRAAALDDAAALHALIVRSEAFDGIPRVLELEELVEELDSSDIDLANDSLVAIDDAGAIVGAIWFHHQRAEIAEQRCAIDGVVAPEHRLRGIGGALVEFAVERATAVLEAIDDDLPKHIRLHAYDHVESAHRLAARCGFEIVRYFDDLLRPLTDLPARRAVEGLDIVPWPEGQDEELRILKNTAFLDHWGSTPTSEEQWHQQLFGFGSRRDLSLVGVDVATGEPVAVLVSARYEADDELLGRKDGWISILATRRDWRGRGVGSALIVEALHAYAAAGLTHASIGVDSENPSGAARLYRSLGFEPNQRIIAHRITVSP